jgi:hypothetical protein
VQYSPGNQKTLVSWQSLIYGLYIRANLPIPGLPELSTTANRPIELEVTFGEFPDWLRNLLELEPEEYYVSPWRDEAGEPHLKLYKLAGGAYFHFQYQEGVEFACDSQGKRVWGTWKEELTLEYAALYFLGPIMGFLLRRRGITCLHASCLAVGESALALVGVSGAGKSTTAAALSARGLAVLSDDVLPLIEKEGEFYGIPGYPRLRLWPESVEALYGDREAQPQLAPNYNKRYLALSPGNFSLHPFPLKAIYFLDWSSQGDAPTIITCPPAEGFMNLVANTYRNELLDKEMRQQEFVCLSRLANRIALRRISAYRDLAKLSLLCDSILEDFFQNSNRNLY